ncbi:MAG: MalY/PatB family protein [Desulfobacteraceae bacterium]
MEKEWNFDEIIDRSGTRSVKWEPSVLGAKFGKGRDDLLPMWVADMDFFCPPVVKKAMASRLDHQIYGYTLQDKDHNSALIDWYRRRHGWTIQEEWVLNTPGVVPAVNYLVQRFSKPGDKILIQPPVYYPFARAIETGGRRVAENPLAIIRGRYQMDFDDLREKAADPRVKAAILCSPHNPVGRVWTREELDCFGQICLDNNVLVFADEIHCDLVMPGHAHTCFQSICDRFANNSITANAASKTFNLAGLSHSNLIVPDERIRTEMGLFFETLGGNPRGGGTLFGAIAARAAYEEGEPWLEDLIDYLYENYRYLKQQLETRVPGVRIVDLEATYLPWVDFRSLELTSEQIADIVEQKAGLALDHGPWFGTGGEGFERINIACPRALVERAVDALVEAFSSV